MLKVGDKWIVRRRLLGVKDASGEQVWEPMRVVTIVSVGKKQARTNDGRRLPVHYAPATDAEVAEAERIIEANRRAGAESVRAREEYLSRPDIELASRVLSLDTDSLAAIGVERLQTLLGWIEESRAPVASTG